MTPSTSSMPKMQGSRSTPHMPPAPKPGEFVFPLPGQRPPFPINEGPKGAAAAVVLKPKTDLERQRRRSSLTANLSAQTIEVPPQIVRQTCRHEHDVDAGRCSCEKYDPSIWLPNSLFNDLTFALDGKPVAQELLTKAAIPGCKSSDFYLYIKALTSKTLGQGRFVSYRLRESVKHQVTEKLLFSKLPRPEKLEYDVNCVLLPLLLRFCEEYHAVKKYAEEKNKGDPEFRRFLGDAAKPASRPARAKILCSCGHGSLWHSEKKVAAVADAEDDQCIQCNTTESQSFAMKSKEGEDPAPEEKGVPEDALEELRKERLSKASCEIVSGRLQKPKQTMLRSAASSLGFNHTPQFSMTMPHLSTMGFRYGKSTIEPPDQSQCVERPAPVRHRVRGSESGK